MSDSFRVFPISIEVQSMCSLQDQYLGHLNNLQRCPATSWILLQLYRKNINNTMMKWLELRIAYPIDLRGRVHMDSSAILPETFTVYDSHRSTRIISIISVMHETYHIYPDTYLAKIWADMKGWNISLSQFSLIAVQVLVCALCSVKWWAKRWDLNTKDGEEDVLWMFNFDCQVISSAIPQPRMGMEDKQPFD